MNGMKKTTKLGNTFRNRLVSLNKSSKNCLLVKISSIMMII